MKKQIAAILFLSLFATGCGPMTNEDAIELIRQKQVYNEWFYAPLHIGRQVAALDEGADFDAYLADRYGILKDNGLIDIEILHRSGWRNVYNISLTEKGAALVDPTRGDADHAFVAVFKLFPQAIDTLLQIDDVGVECRYTIVQKDLTPFGAFLGYEEGTKYHIIDTLAN